MTTETRGRPAVASVRPHSNGHKEPTVHLEPPKRRVRLPELAVGVLVVVAFSLGAVLWHLNSVSKSPALTVVARVERGEPIRAEDLRVIYVASDDRLARVDPSQTSSMVGRIALVNLEPGALLNPSMVSDAISVGAGDAVVGLSLDPGQYPAMTLAVGDRVTVVQGAETPDGKSVVLSENATVYAVEDLASDRKLVSILAPKAEAQSVASAAGKGALRLVLVGS